ncbi:MULTISPECIES: lipid asymmetry maintenance protein MlaB [Pseudomonas syringae group]|uniref:STAS domain-containing protein n=2 Tax=Pseudomonas syringae group TaxID=136849 RepID=A0ABX6HIA9_9PSED|nr:STAS domain-containing protein [Pseudomonas asturiensis]QHF05317.1 STAS domain-containing protein [Pseudomonas asturiensis]
MPMLSETIDDTVRVSIDGELTIYTVTELAAWLLPQIGATPHMEIGLSQVTEMDGAGLQLLAVVEREAGRTGTTLSLSGQSKAVLETFELCHPGAFV